MTEEEKKVAAYRKKVFLSLLQSEKIPAPVMEYRFHPNRKWEFDYAWPEYKVFLEVEGGVWTKGRHTSGSGFMGDMEKYNAAACLGWRLIRVVPTDLIKIKTVDLIRVALQA